MQIKVNLTRRNETMKLELKEKSTVEDILKKINLKPDTVVVMIKNIPVPIDNIIKDGQEFTILQVSSGG